MNLNKSQWKEFRFGDLISDIYKAKAINKDDLTVATENSNAIRYITRTGEDNGCELLADIRDIDTKIIEKGNAITIGDTTATCFYQEEDFITGDHMVVIRADSWLNPYTALYIVTILTNEQYKYSYGRAYVMDRIKNTIIKLPANDNDNPDWQFIEKYIKSLHHKSLTTKNKKGQAPDLNVTEWKEFQFGDLISDIYKAKAINKDDISVPVSNNDAIPYITRTEGDNGCERLASISNIDSKYIEKGNAISIGDTTATCFYQKEDFIAGDHMVVIRADSWLNEYTGLYVTTILNKERIKYSYGRAFLIDRIRNTTIRLPVDSSGNPDWQYMEDYIKSLPYGDRLS